MMKFVIITSKFNIMTGERNTLYKKNEDLRETESWINYRIDIFMRYTAQSLIKQTNQNFIALYAYEDASEALILKALSMYPNLPNNIMFIKKSNYASYIEKITENVDILFLTRLDSDDMYINTFVQTLYDYNTDSKYEVLLCRNGYVFDSTKEKLVEYSHTAFTFYTFIYRLYNETQKYDSLEITPLQLLINFFHFSVVSYKYDLIPARSFIFNIHGDNTDSKFPTESFMWYTVGKEISNINTLDSILRQFYKK